MNLKKIIPWWFGVEAFPEYQGADVTILTQSITSVNDPANNIALKIIYPTIATNLPVKICLSGYHDTILNLESGEDNLTRWARLGYFIVGVDVRGNGSSAGQWDDAGRTTMDVFDAVQHVANNFQSIISPGRFSVMGFSGGGGLAFLLACRYPDLFQDITTFFGISDWGSDPTFGWYQQEPSRQAALSAAIGGNPISKPDEYASRHSQSAIAINHKGFLTMFHDVDDTSVQVDHSRRVVSAYDASLRTDYFYSESSLGSPSRWLHAYPLTTNDLHDAEILWKNNAKTNPINTIPTSGTLKVLGMVRTKLFTIYMNDGNYLNAGRSRLGTCIYNTVANTYEVTNDSQNYAVVSVITNSGLVAVGALQPSETFIFVPEAIAFGGEVPVMWLDAGGKNLIISGEMVVLVDKTGGPGGQGYAFRNTTGLPTFLPADLNGLPAISFDGSTEYLESDRRLDIEGINKLTLISVSTGVYLGYASSSFNHIQQALSGGNVFSVIATNQNTFGSYAGESATYLVRSMIFDGTQGENALRLIARKNKIQQTQSYTGTIPTTTLTGNSIARIGRRAYDTLFLGGKLAEVLLFATVVPDIDSKENILKVKYAV